MKWLLPALLASLALAVPASAQPVAPPAQAQTPVNAYCWNGTAVALCGSAGTTNPSTALTNSAAGTMGLSATIVVPFSATRKWLMITNRTTGSETQDIGSSNVTVGGGIPLAPGGGFLFNGAGAAGPIYGITTNAGSAFSYVEG